MTIFQTVSFCVINIPNRQSLILGTKMRQKSKNLDKLLYILDQSHGKNNSISDFMHFTVGFNRSERNEMVLPKQMDTDIY